MPSLPVDQHMPGQFLSLKPGAEVWTSPAICQLFPFQSGPSDTSAVTILLLAHVSVAEVPADVLGLDHVDNIVIQSWNLVLRVNIKKLRRQLLSLG